MICLIVMSSTSDDRERSAASIEIFNVIVPNIGPEV